MHSASGNGAGTGRRPVNSTAAGQEWLPRLGHTTSGKNQEEYPTGDQGSQTHRIVSIVARMGAACGPGGSECGPRLFLHQGRSEAVRFARAAINSAHPVNPLAKEAAIWPLVQQQVHQIGLIGRNVVMVAPDGQVHRVGERSGRLWEIGDSAEGG